MGAQLNCITLPLWAAIPSVWKQIQGKVGPACQIRFTSNLRETTKDVTY